VNGVRLVVLDWAGTAVDHGSRAPVAAFVGAFAAHGVPITAAEARIPMGLAKGDHIRALLRVPDIARRWRQQHGRDWTEADAASLYDRFVPLQLEMIDRHASLVPYLLPAVEALRESGVRIGATTGYFRAAAQRVYAAAHAQGYAPDACACAEEVPAGRPAPWMMFRLMEALGVYPPATVVKVGDTVPDVAEGLAAGAWSVAVLRTGNEVGCTEEEWAGLPEDEQRRRVEAARRKLLAAGAHAAIETLAELPGLIADISARLRRGEKP
jgi:phosphonoacetaldehyde hydrolase